MIGLIDIACGDDRSELSQVTQFNFDGHFDRFDGHLWVTLKKCFFYFISWRDKLE
jgi:hypothetical protein